MPGGETTMDTFESAFDSFASELKLEAEKVVQFWKQRGKSHLESQSAELLDFLR